MTIPRPKVLLSWSSGKDSAWALHVLRQQPYLVLVSQIRRRKASGPAGHISLGGWVVSGCVPREFSAEPPITRCD